MIPWVDFYDIRLKRLSISIEFFILEIFMLDFVKSSINAFELKCLHKFDVLSQIHGEFIEHIKIPSEAVALRVQCANLNLTPFFEIIAEPSSNKAFGL